ncbi:AAA family ATPase, partial [Streptomyces sp. NPDC059762]|uniref:AAA family ATPase n=1 Tax=Streptomyces sp. NPDC059762 TaxID=3346938 RepID=UPI003658178D
MPVVHVMTGLPASGKTTAARALQERSEGRMRRVNLDDLRSMLDLPGGDRRSRAHEQTVLDIQDVAVRTAVAARVGLVGGHPHHPPPQPPRRCAARARGA